MIITLTMTEFTESWEGDGMRPGDNSRSDSWTGQLVGIKLTENETSNIYLSQAVEEYPRRQELSTSIEDVQCWLTERVARLEWAAEWSKFFGLVQDDGWYVGVDYASADEPEIYDSCGNYITIVPQNIKPGDFEALADVVVDAFDEM
jgi:hypothetical protein